MSDDRMFERDARAWLELGPQTAPRRPVEAALATIKTTPQRRVFGVPWRLPQMTSRTRFALAAAVGVIAIALAGAVLVQRPQNQVGSPSPTPTVVMSPSASPVSLQDLQAMWASVGTRNDPTGHVANPPQLEAMNVDQAGLRINSFRGDITNSVSIGSAGSQLVLRMEAPQYMLTNQNWDCHAGDLGTYSASLSEDKQTLTLASVTDACTTRAAILAGGWTRWSCPQESSDGYSQYAYCSHVSELAPGRYVSPVFKPFAAVGGQLAYTVPAGWAKLSPPPTWPDAGSASRVWLTRVDAPDRQEISIFSNVGVSGGGCAGPFAPNRPASSAADYLASLPYLSVFGRAPVEIGGLTGVQIDLSVVEGSVVQCTDPEGQVDYSTDIEIFASDDDAIILGPRDGNFARFIVLNSTDGSVVIEVSAPDQLTLDARVAEAMPVIHSFEFIR